MRTHSLHEPVVQKGRRAFYDAIRGPHFTASNRLSLMEIEIDKTKMLSVEEFNFNKSCKEWVER